MLPITEIAGKIGIGEDDLELYGKYKAKVTEEFIRKCGEKPDGKLVLVTAINPTPAGEGKTTTSVGLGMALSKLGKKAITRSESRRSDLSSASKAARQAADTLRSFRWRT